MVRFTGTLPAPLKADDFYYVIPLTDTTLSIAESYDDAIEGTALDIIADGSGVIIAEDYTFMSTKWLMKRRDRMVVPIVERIVNFNLREVKEVTEYYSGTGERVMMLNRRNITEVTKIELLNNYLVDKFVDLGNIYLVPNQGIIKAGITDEENNSYFPRGTRNIRITYKYGFTILPDDIHEAVLLLLCEVMLTQIAGSTGGGTSLGTAGYNKDFGERGKYTTIRNDITRTAMSLLNNYKTHVVGQK